MLKSGRIAFVNAKENGMAAVNISATQSRLDMLSNPNTLHFSSAELSKVSKKELDEAFLEEYGYTFEQFSNCIFQIIGFGENIQGDIKTVNKASLIEHINKEIKIEKTIIEKIIKDILLPEDR